MRKHLLPHAWICEKTVALDGDGSRLRPAAHAPGWKWGRRRLLLAAAGATLALTSGCVSVPVGGGGSDVESYNHVTGYPAVGGQRWLGW